MLDRIAYCKIAETFVLGDQTQKECAVEHKCPDGTQCPLDGCFSEEFGAAKVEQLCVRVARTIFKH